MGVLEFSQAAGRAVSAPSCREKFADMEETPYDRAGVDDDYPLQLWDFENIREPRLLRGHTMPITCAATGASCSIARLPKTPGWRFPARRT